MTLDMLISALLRIKREQGGKRPVRIVVDESDTTQVDRVSFVGDGIGAVVIWGPPPPDEGDPAPNSPEDVGYPGRSR